MLAIQQGGRLLYSGGAIPFQVVHALPYYIAETNIIGASGKGENAGVLKVKDLSAIDALGARPEQARKENPGSF